MTSQIPQNDPFFIRFLKMFGPYLLTAGGLAGGYSVAQKLTQNLAVQIIIALAVGLLGYAVSFAGKVWQEWEGSLIKKTASWVPSFLKNRFAGYRRRYLTYLSHAHRVVEFSGLLQRPAYNRDIASIFVEPEISSLPPHLASAHLLKRPQLPTSDTHAIWHYLSESTPGSDVLVLLGAAGSGKTTLLKAIAFSLSQPRSRAHFIRRHHLHQSLPVLLLLREHLSTIQDKPDCTLPELVQAQVHGKGHLSIPLQWFEQQFKQGKCLVMLDGLDEAPDEQGSKLLVKWIQAQFLSYANNRFLITARPHGYVDTPLDDAIVLAVQPFSPEQIQRFIKHWFLIDELRRSEKHDPGVSLRAAEGAGNLFARLNQKPSLLELAANPLLLTMMTILSSTGGSLPNDRLELYREIFQVLLYRRRDAIGLSPRLNVQQKLEVLQPLAFHMMQKHVLELAYDRLCQVVKPLLEQVAPEFTAAEFLKDIEQNSGLLLEVSTGSWGFAHKTFQEYLAANHIKEKRRESFLRKQIADPWWEESICFYCAQADATNIIQSCLAQADTSVRMLELALECHSQKLRADPAISQQIEVFLKTGVEDVDSRKRAIVAEALLKRRLAAMVYLSDDVYTDTSLLSCAEYQLFLDEQSTQGIYYHPWHWPSPTFPPGQGRKPVLGVQPAHVQAFCAWLTARENGLWRYRLPRQSEVAAVVSHLKMAAQSVTEVGFWAEDDSFTWLSGTPPEGKNLEELALDQLLLDRAEALSYQRVRASDRREIIDEALELERERDDIQAPTMNALLVHGMEVQPLVVDPSYFGRTLLERFVKREFYAEILSDIMKIDTPVLPKTDKHHRWLIRYLSQLQAYRSYLQMQRPTSARKRRGHLLRQRELETSLAEQNFAFCRKLCLDLTLLELRVRGKLSPWEGMVLVKEREQFSLP